MAFSLRREIPTHNPIIWQEFTHQRRAAPRAFRHWSVLGPLLLSTTIAVVFLTLTDLRYPTRDLAMFTLWIVHAATAIRAITAGGNAISREHVGQTWDALVLTGVSARQILFGKWQAALRRVAPWMLALGTLRLLMLPVFTLALVNRYAWRVGVYGMNTYSTSYSPQYGGYVDLPPLAWLPLPTISAVFAVIVMTLLEVMACTAIGLAASAIARRGVLAVVIALSVRFLPVAVFAAFTRYEVGPSRFAYRMLRYPLFSLADSGNAAISQLVLPFMPWTYTLHGDALVGLLMAMGLLVILLSGALLSAWAAIRMTGALPHPITKPYQQA